VCRRVKFPPEKSLRRETTEAPCWLYVVGKGKDMSKEYLSKKDVEHIAWLAHIEVSEEEKELFTEQFNDILDYFKKIDQVNTDGIEPTYHVLDMTNVSRKDEVDPSLTNEEALKNAPRKEEKFVKAPRIV
jgi:aspartyl-tRNA(Asn)/glutamyl-tRNA(Gln) amidotransferase subunit C